MKAFLLAAGLGTRLRPLTDHVPKCMVPIQGVPLLQIWLQLCRNHGIDEVLVNVHAHAQVVQDFLREQSIVQATAFNEPTLLGSAGTLRANRKWVEDEKDFYILYADVLTNVNLTLLRETHCSHAGLATLGVQHTTQPQSCGIVEQDGTGCVVGFEEKPAHPRGTLAFTGVMIAKPEALVKIPDETTPCDIGFHLLPRLLGSMYVHRVDEYLQDIGGPEQYNVAQREWPGLLFGIAAAGGT